MNYQHRPFPAGLDMQGRYDTRPGADEEHIPTEAAASATEIGADDYEPADQEVLEWMFKGCLKLSIVLILGVVAWQVLDSFSAGVPL